MCAYASTPNKAAVRSQWDRPVLDARALECGPLTYLGLPGPDIHDLIEWRDLLAKLRTGVEAAGHTRRQRAEADAKISRLLLNVSIQHLGEGFELLTGDIEDILINGHDVLGHSPQLQHYDFVNLDFDGGFGFFAAGDVKRPRALRALLQRQRGQPFILFLTVNVRDTLGSEVANYLGGMLDEAKSTDEADLVRWRLGRPDGERVLKLQPVIADFVRESAEGEGFSCVAFPLVTYEGYARARMMHFVFQLTPISSLKGFSEQSITDILELPVFEAINGRLSVAWAPTNSDIGSTLAFLDPAVAATIVEAENR